MMYFITRQRAPITTVIVAVFMPHFQYLDLYILKVSLSFSFCGDRHVNELTSSLFPILPLLLYRVC